MKLIQPDWPAPANIRACTTTRSIWGENNTNEVDERAKLVSRLNLPDDPIWLKQTHSTIALPATAANRNQEADASYTDASDTVCLVLTADCLPVLICNEQGTKVAAIHAGWRGLAAGVIESTIQSMESDPANLLIWLGPAIGPQKFEVGKDVFDAFTQNDAAASSCFIPGQPDKWMANLYQLATHRLNKLGVTRIYGGKYCTYSQDDLFFSWRRDKSKTARLASMIWMT
jgi:polyphenol oxidase